MASVMTQEVTPRQDLEGGQVSAGTGRLRGRRFGRGDKAKAQREEQDLTQEPGGRKGHEMCKGLITWARESCVPGPESCQQSPGSLAGAPG